MAIKKIAVTTDAWTKEALAAGTITPGFLIERTSAGTVQAHSAAGQNAAKLFAIEDDLQGNEIDDNYTSGNNVRFIFARPGDLVYAYLATGQNITNGHLLESAGTGYLRRHTASSAGAVEYPESIVGQAIESVNATSAAARILIEVW